MILIDTSVAVDFLRGRERGLSVVESSQKSTEVVGFSAVSMYELLSPIHHQKLDRQERIVRSFVHRLRLLPFDAEAADASAKIMGSLLRIGKPLNPVDVIIAGTAVANGAEKLISLDADFERIAQVSDLKVEVL